MKELLSTVLPDSILADTPDGEPVRIDFEQLIGQHTLVAAKTGFGKSVLLRKIKHPTIEGSAFTRGAFGFFGNGAGDRDRRTSAGRQG